VHAGDDLGANLAPQAIAAFKEGYAEGVMGALQQVGDR